MQQVIEVGNHYKQLDNYLQRLNIKKLFLVCGGSIRYLEIGRYFENLEERLGIEVVRFSNFKPNPLYESVAEGTQLFDEQACELIVAVGGGSAIDVAKCIKLYANMDHSKNYLKQPIIPNDIPFLAVPTTAGTGSEATRYAVIYYEGEKQSVADYSGIPCAVLIDPTVLETLPEYQKKATMMDTLCHATEAFWSVNSTKESQEYSTEAIELFFKNYKGYLENTKEGNAGMLKAANVAGKAINITQTTAGHAMCYKLTSLYGISHGHAAALCISKLFPYMVKNTQFCIDPRGKEYLDETFKKLAQAYGCEDALEAAQKFENIVKDLDLEVPKVQEKEIEILKKSVNPVRLKNNPVKLDEDKIEYLYREIVLIDKERK